ncbi:hypothetical protein, partial [Paraburkholderia caledonica]|uniref:hypothetical protein n=1 Tax=Paraburkholderia caledonica TaxID=134536 RepID=UPI003C8903CC
DRPQANNSRDKHSKKSRLSRDVPHSRTGSRIAESGLRQKAAAAPSLGHTPLITNVWSSR